MGDKPRSKSAEREEVIGTMIFYGVREMTGPEYKALDGYDAWRALASRVLREIETWDDRPADLQAVERQRDEAVRMHEATVAEAVEQRRRAETAEKERDDARASLDRCRRTLGKVLGAFVSSEYDFSAVSEEDKKRIRVREVIRYTLRAEAEKEAGDE